MPEAIETFDPGKLADISLPEVITFWPVAPGWWILLGLIILLIIFTIYLVKRKPKKRLPTARQLKSQALKELASIREYYESQNNESQESNENSHETVKKLSVFLRRYALSLYPREIVALLTDEQWLTLLDNLSESSDKPFSSKFSIMLTQAPYQSVHEPIDTQLLSELITTTEVMIKNSYKDFEAKKSVQGNITHV